MGAVHGALVGGGVAGCMHTDYLAADRASVFEHGNLPRGVCVLGMLSQTFVRALGPQAQHVYLRNTRLDASAALAVGLVHATCKGALATQIHAREAARLEAVNVGLVAATCRLRALADSSVIASESMRHTECQLTNGGFAKSRFNVLDGALDLHPVVHTDGCEVTGPPLPLGDTVRLASGSMRLQAKQHMVPLRELQVITMSRSDDCASCATFLWLVEANANAAELVGREHQLLLWLNNSFFIQTRATCQPERTLVTLGFDVQTGVAAVELDATSIAQALEAAMLLLAKLGPVLRAVVLQIGTASCGYRLHASERTMDLMDRTLHSLQTLCVPTVCSADVEVVGIGLKVWLAADYRLTSPLTCSLSALSGLSIQRAIRPNERALYFAAWLAHHPAIGLR
jgi:enoyl-CoA hydratase/carnithine racemase